MAQGLNLVIEITTAAEGGDPAADLVQGLTQGAGTGPQILHYAWAVNVSAKIPPKTGIATVLLTTVYDEDFADYISDLVTANPGPFNKAAASIVGLQGLRPVESPENLPKFIQFVKDNDLNGGGAGNPTWFEAYDANVVTILAALAGS
jgi:hypothetical protein